MIFAMPCNPMNHREVDFDFQAEYDALQLLGQKVVLFDIDDLQPTSTKWLKQFGKPIYDDEIVIYRGWMLTDLDYSIFENGLRSLRYKLLQTEELYSEVHYFPYAHSKSEIIRLLSPRLHSITMDADYAMKNAPVELYRVWFDDKPYMVKDWVKSAKGVENAMFVENPVDTELALETVCNMIKARKRYGFNKGIVAKKIVPVEKDQYGNPYEWRAFILNGEIVSVNLNNGSTVDIDIGTPEFLLDIAKQLDAKFLTIDFARLTNGNLFVVETGAGEVSGLPPTLDPLVFYNKLLDILL